MRVNIEDDLWTSGRLLKLARVMKWEEAKTLGHLALVYRATQKAGIIIDSQPRVLTVCVLHFESDEETERFLTAMVASQLASILEDGNMHIRGNEKHVRRLERLASKASDAGKASAAKRYKKLNDSQTESQPTGNPQGTITQPVGNAPYSLLPLLSSKEDLAQAPRQLTLVEEKPKAKRPRAKPAESSTETHQLRQAFEAAFEGRYGTKYLSWDGASGKYAKSLVADGGLSRVLPLIQKYFDLALKEPHTFFEGFDSFRAHINKLNAKHQAVPMKKLSFAEQQQREQEIAEASLRALDAARE